MTTIAYVAACDPTGGIYSFTVGANGELTPLEKIALDRPHYLAIEGNKMYVLLREPFGNGNTDSGLMTYDIDTAGRLSNPSAVVSVGGRCAAHHCVKNGVVYITNYLSGSAGYLSAGQLVKMVQHKGHGTHPQRQEAPHTHQVLVTPDGKYVSVVDLGLDKIFFYDLQLNLVREVAARPGVGVRHLVYVGADYAFCANELEGAVTAYKYHDGNLTELDTSPTLPAGFVSPNGNICAAIRATKDGKYVFVSNRGHDSIACFKHSAGRLERYAIVPCGGAFPRDFDFTPDEKFLFSCNERSHDVTAFAFRDGVLTALPGKVAAQGALCVVYKEI